MCKECGHIWEAKPNNILNGRGCPICKQSKGEKKISQFLDKNNISYIAQYKFEDCIYVNPLPFDFYLPQMNLLIEYDGIQHFEPCTFGGIDKQEALKAFRFCQIRDEIKNQYCKSRGIKLLRIPYTKFKEIDIILTSIIC